MPTRQLPEHVTEFLSGMSETELANLKDAVRFWRDMQALCRFTRWIIWAAFAGAFVIWQGIDGIRHILGMAGKKIGN